MVNRSVLSDGTMRFEDERGVAFLRMLKPGVPLLTYSGHIKVDFYEALVIEYRQELERARRDRRQLVILADGWELKGMDTAYRERWVQWIKEHRAHVATILALLHSRQVVMAANIMSMLIGRGLIRTYADPRDFELEERSRIHVRQGRRCAPPCRRLTREPGSAGRGQPRGGAATATSRVRYLAKARVTSCTYCWVV
jgi:hypothetical protein